MLSELVDFESLHSAYREKIKRYLTRLVGENEAEDLTQEVFLRVNRALATFRGESLVSTWIYRIATNLAIDRMRSYSYQREGKETTVEDVDEAAPQNIWSGEPPASLEQQVFRKERYECFIEFVQALPLNYRTVLVLSELEEMPDREIAEILGLSLETVKIRLHRGRSRLLQELRENCQAEDWL